MSRTIAMPSADAPASSELRARETTRSPSTASEPISDEWIPQRDPFDSSIRVRRIDSQSYHELSADGALAEIVARYLSFREHEAWTCLRGTTARRREWLLGRVAAKEVVRHTLQEIGASVAAATEIEIVPDERGCPHVRGAWLRDVTPIVPMVSISHVGGTIVAAATCAPAIAGIGIDIERPSRINDDVLRLAFTARERLLVDVLPPSERAGWFARLWCAKEAASKALGLGLFTGLCDLSVRSIDVLSGVVALAARVSARGAERLEPRGWQPMLAYTSSEADLAAAVCLRSRGREGGP